MKIYFSVLRVLLIFAATSFIVIGTMAFIQHWEIAGILLSIGFALFSIILFDIVLIQKVFRAKK